MAISAVINTYNAAEHLERVIENLRGFREVLVCDMESTDGTPQLAARLGARVITFKKGKYNYSDPARMAAIKAATSKWVLVVDADEIVPLALCDYLNDFVKDPGDVAGLYIPRQNYVFNRIDATNYPDYQLRFFVKDLANWPPVRNSVPKVNGRVIRIPSGRTDLALRHISHCLHNMVTKFNDATSLDAARDGQSPPSPFGLVWKPLTKFLSSYILKGGWRLGMGGYVTACNAAYARYLTMAKVFENHLIHKIQENDSSDTARNA